VQRAWSHFSFLSFSWEGWCTYACCILIYVSYHVCMFASLYHRLHLYHMPLRCASLICFDHHDILDMKLWLCLWCSLDV
jgi:hypothetical protein